MLGAPGRSLKSVWFDTICGPSGIWPFYMVQCISGRSMQKLIVLAISLCISCLNAADNQLQHPIRAQYLEECITTKPGSFPDFCCAKQDTYLCLKPCCRSISEPFFTKYPRFDSITVRIHYYDLEVFTKALRLIDHCKILCIISEPNCWYAGDDLLKLIKVVRSIPALEQLHLPSATFTRFGRKVCKKLYDECNHIIVVQPDSTGAWYKQ